MVSPTWRAISRWYEPVASRSSSVCPVGAVSITTKCRRDSWTTLENCRNTATSSVHGDNRSSARAARPSSSRFRPLVSITWLRYSSMAASGSMRETVRPGIEPWSVSVRCAAGSVVVRWTACPRFARATAMAAATVVFPTPPLPIHITRPWPLSPTSFTSAASGASSTSASSAASSVMSASEVAVKSDSSAGMPTILPGFRSNMSRGSEATASGMAAMAAASRARNACARSSSPAASGRTPLTTT